MQFFRSGQLILCPGIYRSSKKTFKPLWKWVQLLQLLNNWGWAVSQAGWVLSVCISCLLGSTCTALIICCFSFRCNFFCNEAELILQPLQVPLSALQAVHEEAGSQLISQLGLCWYWINEGWPGWDTALSDCGGGPACEKHTLNRTQEVWGLFVHPWLYRLLVWGKLWGGCCADHGLGSPPAWARQGSLGSGKSNILDVPSCSPNPLWPTVPGSPALHWKNVKKLCLELAGRCAGGLASPLQRQNCSICSTDEAPVCTAAWSG